MSDAATRIAARITELWHSSRPSILERIAALHAAQSSLGSDPEDLSARNQGREAAHKLSGVLGVFGLPRGSELASEIEHLLLPGPSLGAGDLARLRTCIAELDTVISSKDPS